MVIISGVPIFRIFTVQKKITYLPENLINFLFLLFSTVYNGKQRDMLFNTERSKGIFAREYSIVNENAPTAEGSLMHYQLHLSNYLFRLFLTL